MSYLIYVMSTSWCIKPRLLVGTEALLTMPKDQTFPFLPVHCFPDKINASDVVFCDFFAERCSYCGKAMSITDEMGPNAVAWCC